MKLLLDIKDSKADFIIELLRNFPFVKAKPLTPAKAQLMEEIKESVEEVKLARQGKAKLKTLDQLLNEL